MTAPSSSPTDAAARAWTAMYAFVSAEDRPKSLRDELGLGPGKVALLMMLVDGPMTLREIADAIMSRLDPMATR
jgi:hypothetical protein